MSLAHLDRLTAMGAPDVDRRGPAKLGRACLRTTYNAKGRSTGWNAPFYSFY